MTEMKLNLGCGDNRIEGFSNIDIFDGDAVDAVVDLNKFPYPWKDNSIEYIYCTNTLEHLRDPELFWFEVFRILKPKARIEVRVPHYKSKGSYCTFGHRSFFHEDAIDSVTASSEELFVCDKFRLIEKKVTRGRFLKWQKREIRWVVEKIQETSDFLKWQKKEMARVMKEIQKTSDV